MSGLLITIMTESIPGAPNGWSSQNPEHHSQLRGRPEMISIRIILERNPRSWTGTWKVRFLQMLIPIPALR
jgi:hypothetical protein